MVSIFVIFHIVCVIYVMLDAKYCRFYIDIHNQELLYKKQELQPICPQSLILPSKRHIGHINS
jgi:hypothetical protein